MQRLIIFSFVTTIQHPRILKNNIDHSSKRRPPHCLFGHQSCTWQNSGSFCRKNPWFLFYNMLSFNFVQTPNKSLGFRRFSRSYVHQSVVVPSNRSQSCTACFFLMCAVQNDHIPFFWRLFVPNESVFA